MAGSLEYFSISVQGLIGGIFGLTWVLFDFGRAFYIFCGCRWRSVLSEVDVEYA